ncbi:MAG: VWA domain-containing protein [Planctomycetota bacterium]
MNQGTVNKRGRGIRLRAWGVSIFAHVVVLSVFGVMKFSQQSVNAQQAQAAVSISQARQLSQLPAVIPKPKVVSESRPVSKAKGRMLPNPASQIPNPNYQSIPSSDIPLEPAGLPTANKTQTAQVEFFGSTARGRRICYVVDCSGSMQGLWRCVRGELIESIGRLEADQYFCVIAFGAGSVQQSGGGKMVRASERAKKEAYGFIDSLRPAGATNAPAAIQTAVHIRDDTNVGPSVIYFLTDGFELGEQDGTQFAHQIMTMQRSFSPKTQINTIGFWPGEQDRRTLEKIARESGGEFKVVNDGYNSEAMSGRR